MGGEANREEDSIEKQIGKIDTTSRHYEPTPNVVVNDNFATIPSDYATSLINRNSVSITFWLEHVFPKLDKDKGWLTEQLLIEQRIEVKMPFASAYAMALYIVKTCQEVGKATQKDPNFSGSFYGPSKMGMKPKENVDAGK